MRYFKPMKFPSLVHVKSSIEKCTSLQPLTECDFRICQQFTWKVWCFCSKLSNSSSCKKSNWMNVGRFEIMQSSPQLCGRTCVAAFPLLLYPSPVDPTDISLLTSLYYSLLYSSSQLKQTVPGNPQATLFRKTERLAIGLCLSFCSSKPNTKLEGKLNPKKIN